MIELTDLAVAGNIGDVLREITLTWVYKVNGKEVNGVLRFLVNEEQFKQYNQAAGRSVA